MLTPVPVPMTWMSRPTSPARMLWMEGLKSSGMGGRCESRTCTGVLSEGRGASGSCLRRGWWIQMAECVPVGLVSVLTDPLLLLLLGGFGVRQDLELHRDDGVLEDGEEEDGLVQEVEADEGVEGHLGWDLNGG